MNKYLLEILQETNTVIIPGLGALTVTNKEKGEIMFMSYLKHDDGKLSSYISKKDNVDETEAKNIIAKYVREIRSIVDQGESFDVYGLGSFFKGPEGDIEFTYENAGKSSVKTSPTQVEKSRVEEEEKELKSTIEETISEVEKHKEKSEQKDEKTNDRPLNIVEKKELTDNVEKLEKLKKSKPKKETVRKKKDKKVVKDKQPKKEQKQKKKRGAGFWIILLLIVLLLAGGTYFGLNYNELKQSIPFLADQKEDNTTQDNPLDKMKEILGEEESLNNEEEGLVSTDVTNDSIEDQTENHSETEPKSTKDQTITEESPAEESPTTYSNETSSGPYKVIAGAFSVEENAIRQVEKFKAEGLPAETFVNSNGLHVVVMKSFETSQAAKAELNSLKAISPNAWLMYRP